MFVQAVGLFPYMGGPFGYINLLPIYKQSIWRPFLERGSVSKGTLSGNIPITCSLMQHYFAINNSTENFSGGGILGT